MEQVGEDIIYFTTTGLQKMDASGALLWKFDFFDLDEYRYSPKPALGAITTDELGNTYAQLSFPASEPGFTTINNIDIPHGSSLVKINSEGDLLWCRKMENSKFIRLEYHGNYVYVLGSYDTELNIADTFFFDNVENTACGNGGWQNEYAQDIFIARFNTIGQVQNVITIANPGYDVPKAFTTDRNGNVYVATNYGLNSCLPDETRLYKFNSELTAIWSETISKEYIEGNGSGVLEPANLYIGENGKLYLWAYSGGTVISNDYRFEDISTYGNVGGILEYNANDASFLRYRAFSGMSIDGRQGFMAIYKDHLLIATTFRESKEFDNGTISTVSQGEEPLLLKVDLNNFQVDHVLHLKGRPRNDYRSIKDWSGPIQVKNDDLYYSGNFSSDTLLLDSQNILVNNSGNNDQDFFLIKYNLSATDFVSEFQDDDLDGISNAYDHCPNTPPGLETDTSGCALMEKDSDLDGVADEGDSCPDSPPGASVDENGCEINQLDDDMDGIPNHLDECPDSDAGATVNSLGCEIIELDVNSFSIEVFAEICPGNSDGAIIIEPIDDTLEYIASLNETTFQKFSGKYSFDSLSPGHYELCITAADIDSDQICYTLQVEAASRISMDAKADLVSNKLRIELRGAMQFTIEYNGKSFDTDQNYLELDLEEGENRLTATSEKICQGSASYLLNVGQGIEVLPNPFSDFLEMNHLNEEGTLIRVYNQNGRIVHKERFNANTKVRINNLNGLSPGIYVVELQAANKQYFQKVIKQ